MFGRSGQGAWSKSPELFGGLSQGAQDVSRRRIRIQIIIMREEEEEEMQRDKTKTLEEKT